MSIGIGGKMFGKVFEFYIGKSSYSHSLSLISVSLIVFDQKFSLLGLEVAIRW